MSDSDDVEYVSDKENVEQKLQQVEVQLAGVRKQIRTLESKRRRLEAEQTRLTDQLQARESDKLKSQDWGRSTFPWSDKLQNCLSSVFCLTSFRPDQLAVINASLSGHDCLLVMPTGGGKSLTYQLPAVAGVKGGGVTLVVSPLLSLMEDQLLGLKRLGVRGVEMLTGNSDKETKARVQRDMLDDTSDLCLLYVTPEKCSKSKQFMTKLQKMHQAGRFARLAVDEVHCCSQWGHDFRPDYKFLGAMKTMFPDVPILGLTATSTTAVTKDVKEILRIPQAMVFRAGFNRPNLHYSVRLKPEGKAENMDLLANLVGTQFRGQSGIIYTTTTKEVETIVTELRGRGLKAGPYHAQMEPPEARSRVHQKWVAGQLQVVVATIAFGMGIDKPDVRFVIHNTISRSMENFYQESGRAGRDHAPATCLLLFRMSDVFKQSSMVFSEQTGQQKLYSMVAYCLDTETCRRKLIAEHFLDTMEEDVPCNKMCDNCMGEKVAKQADITAEAKAAISILTRATDRKVRVTGLKLVEALMGKGASDVKLEGWKGSKKLGKEQLEVVVGHMLVEGYLKEDFHFTPYSVISYLVAGGREVRGDIVLKFPARPDKMVGKRKAEDGNESSQSSKKMKEKSVLQNGKVEDRDSFSKTTKKKSDEKLAEDKKMENGDRKKDRKPTESNSDIDVSDDELLSATSRTSMVPCPICSFEVDRDILEQHAASCAESTFGV